MTPPPSSSSYNAQLQIRRDAEERSIAQQDLGSWMDQMKKSDKVVVVANPKSTKTNELAFKNNTSNSLSSSENQINSSCEDERRRGNKYFEQGKYGDAVQCYTRCLSKSKKDALDSHLVYSNRGEYMKPLSSIAVSSLLCVPADSLSLYTSYSYIIPLAMAHLKMKSWAQAEADATSALQIDPHHFKSYQRRCVARLAMGKVRAAMVDICSAQDGCMLDKSNAVDAKSTYSNNLAEIQKLRKKVEKALADSAKRAPRRRIPVTVVL